MHARLEPLKREPRIANEHTSKAKLNNMIVIQSF